MNSWRDELLRRMSGPQRHRLLQGYPMLPLMRGAVALPQDVTLDFCRDADGELRPKRRQPPTSDAAKWHEDRWMDLDPSRPVIVGVIPHTQCNPRVEGCGFCTFPHDRYHKSLLRESTQAVVAQISAFFAVHPEIERRRVDAVYFGGATANLTPSSELSTLGRTLQRHLDLQSAEITLEGVPNLFRSLLRGPLDALLDMPARHHRISMGVQTFDEPRLTRMGRQGFGMKRDIVRVIELAHRRGCTVSGDFLIDLPSQSREQMLADMKEAMALGFDQICVYHLVLAAGQGTPWAEDAAIMNALPSVAEASDNWLSVQDTLRRSGYVQTTLTNFERADVHATDRRFAYEAHSFAPDVYDAIGFGPLSISTFANMTQRRALKLVRGKAMGHTLWGEHDLMFRYEEPDLRLLYLTRALAKLRVSRARYLELFGGDLVEHFGPAVQALEAAGLVTLDSHALSLTSRGIFYADSIAGLLAWPRVEELRASGSGRHTRDLLDEQVSPGFMG